MKTLQRLVQAGFAACALASVSTPALSWAPWPDIDFEWYANVGKGRTVAAYPAPRAGYIWAPGHYEWSGTRMEWKPGVWIQDGYESEWRMYARGPNTVLANGPLMLRDRDGNVIPTSPEAYPVELARR